MPTPPTALHSTPTHSPTSPTTTDCYGRLMACRQQTAPPQQCSSKDSTAHPHQPGAHPDPPHPDRAQSPPPQSQSQGQVPITEQNFCNKHTQIFVCVYYCSTYYKSACPSRTSEHCVCLLLQDLVQSCVQSQILGVRVNEQSLPENREKY
jgi:hypothetical protein